MPASKTSYNHENFGTHQSVPLAASLHCTHKYPFYNAIFESLFFNSLYCSEGIEKSFDKFINALLKVKFHFSTNLIGAL